MATLKQQVQQVHSDLAKVEIQKIPSSKVVFPKPARSYVGSDQVFDGDVGFEQPYEKTHTTFRSNWRTPEPAIQQTQINTSKLPNASITKGAVQSPATTSATLASAPDMTVRVSVPAHAGDIVPSGGQVQISWHVSASLSTTAAVASFALFRDGVQIGPTAYGSCPVANGKFSVGQNFIDNPGGGNHNYSVYWSTSTGTLTADALNRYMHAMPLTLAAVPST